MLHVVGRERRNFNNKICNQWHLARLLTSETEDSTLRFLITPSCVGFDSGALITCHVSTNLMGYHINYESGGIFRSFSHDGVYMNFIGYAASSPRNIDCFGDETNRLRQITLRQTQYNATIVLDGYIYSKPSIPFQASGRMDIFILDRITASFKKHGILQSKNRRRKLVLEECSLHVLSGLLLKAGGFNVLNSSQVISIKMDSLAQSGVDGSCFSFQILSKYVILYSIG